MMSAQIFHEGVWRMDWGLGNPNLTAALIVQLMCLVWLPAIWCRRWFFLGMAATGALWVCLLHTMSRGGVLGGLTVLSALLLGTRRPWPWARLVSGVVVAVVVVVLSAGLGTTVRLGQGVTEEDKSISNRLLVWSAAPKMFAAAPGGWGLGNSGEAYREWFQPLDRHEVYGSLVNTHLTLLVELGWVAGTLYLLAWFGVVAAGWPWAQWNAGCPRATCVFALVAGFFIVAAFTNMVAAPVLWLLPLGGAAAIVWRFALGGHCLRLHPARFSVFGLAVVAPVAAFCIAGLGGDQRARISKSEGMVEIANGSVEVWVAADDTILGKRPGRVLRAAMRSGTVGHLSVRLAESVRDLPAGSQGALVLPGDTGRDLLASRRMVCVDRIILLNPGFPPDERLPAHSLGSGLLIVFGEFADARHRAAWSRVADVVEVVGAGNYLPNWPQWIACHRDASTASTGLPGRPSPLRTDNPCGHPGAT